MMTDNLVEELRKGWTEDGICENFDEDVLLVAADHIEKLEKALQFYVKATPDYLYGADWEWDCGEKRYGVVAREALEDK
jgi:uncharacterized protein (DUF433 family)